MQSVLPSTWHPEVNRVISWFPSRLVAKSSLKVSPESTSSEPEPRPAMSRNGKKSDVPSMESRMRIVRGVLGAVDDGTDEVRVAEVDSDCRMDADAIAEMSLGET